MDEPSLRVCEIFRSIQGEGTRAGRPCVFVRLAGCGVGCAWCDTGYAADPSAGRDMSLSRLMEEVRAWKTRLTQLTGGEPLEQAESARFACALAREGFEVAVETSGTRDISVLPPPVARIMDVKAPSSGAAGKMHWPNLDILRPDDEIKFVLADRADYEYARRLVGERNLSERATVLFGAVRERLDPAVLADWMLADRLEVRLQLQLHRILWPDIERGK